MNATKDEEIGSRIQRLREQRDLQQKQLIRRLASAGLDWSQATLSKVEAGSRPVRVAELPALASALGVDQQQLLAPGDALKDVWDRLHTVEATAKEAYEDLRFRYLSARLARKSVQLVIELAAGGQGPYRVGCSAARFLSSCLGDSYSETAVSIEDVAEKLGLKEPHPEKVTIESKQELDQINARLSPDNQIPLTWDAIESLAARSRPDAQQSWGGELANQHLYLEALGAGLARKFPQVTFTAKEQVEAPDVTTVDIAGVEGDEDA
ncbi:Transcriptional regulator, contains XRE-family HTH domain [Arthrobacter sp. 31Cvi3.1E]|nr:Transcriptional regulator, contains XRE-family HTH domain [Arthrobacter sp. 31Cvi3.1E]